MTDGHGSASEWSEWEALDASGRLVRVVAASDFAAETLRLQPMLREALLRDDGAHPFEAPVLAPDNRSEWPALLRRFRRAESTRLVWRDVLGLDEVTDTLAGSTRLAEACLQVALTALEREFGERHGVVRNAAGEPQRLVVFGLGKLGGGELNFSSDIDIVYAYEDDGESDGARPLEAEVYFARLGQQLAKLLDEVTAEGFCHRVDLRLRPYGSAGRIAWSFAALEAYFQREGRDWERYAWQKARPVAGDTAAGERFLAMLRPFVYRRYLDFGALEGLREMKALIEAEVARRDMRDDIKRGPGGIREIEFLAQALQLIRGGRDASLQCRGLLPALRALEAAAQLPTEVAQRLRESYRFLRRLENRLQMLRDAQTYSLPSDEADQLRIAHGLGARDWPALLQELEVHRSAVSAEFAALLGVRTAERAGDGLADYWRALPDAGDAAELQRHGYADADSADEVLRHFARTLGTGGISDMARTRLDRLMPGLIAAAGRAAQPDLALPRALGLVQNVLRRSSYLTLLDEQPRALDRLVDALSRSALLSERLAAYPVLLDELLDQRSHAEVVDAARLHRDCLEIVARHQGDVEEVLPALNEYRQAVSFRIALAVLDARQLDAVSTRQLAQLADAVLTAVVDLARRDMARAHGEVPDARFAVLGYGSLGGEELGFGSDLDLVFLYEADAAAQSDGARPLDAQRWHARLAQKIVGWLQTPTGAGRLYDTDVRLRPDGSKALLVTTLQAYADYQRERAWTWEHQALVRARCVVPDTGGALASAFEAARAEVLQRPRAAQALRHEVIEMRRRMRRELDRSTDARFDLKQGEGGLVDLEFLVQGEVLLRAATQAALVEPRRTQDLLQALANAGLMSSIQADALTDAQAQLAGLGLACTLDRRPRIVEATSAVDSARETIRAACAATGFDFSASPGAP